MHGVVSWDRWPLRRRTTTKRRTVWSAGTDDHCVAAQRPSDARRGQLGPMTIASPHNDHATHGVVSWYRWPLRRRRTTMRRTAWSTGTDDHCVATERPPDARRVPIDQSVGSRLLSGLICGLLGESIFFLGPRDSYCPVRSGSRPSLEVAPTAVAIFSSSGLELWRWSWRENDSDWVKINRHAEYLQVRRHTNPQTQTSGPIALSGPLKWLAIDEQNRNKIAQSYLGPGRIAGGEGQIFSWDII